MRNIWTIAKREFNLYFASPIAYAVAFALLLILGLFFYIDISFSVMSQYGGSPQPTDYRPFHFPHAVLRSGPHHAADGRGAAHRHRRTAAHRAGQGMGAGDRQVAGGLRLRF